NYPPALIARAVELGHWSAQRALSTAINIPDLATKAELYIALLNMGKLNTTQQRIAQQRGWEAIWAVENEMRMTLLAKFTSYMNEDMLDPALMFVLRAKRLLARPEVLSALGPRLSA